MALFAYPAFGTKTQAEIDAARTITIRLKDKREAQVDDDLTWYAEDRDVFLDVIPTAEEWPHDDYFPLPLQRAYAVAKWVAEKIDAKVVTPEPKYKPEDYKIPAGAVA